MGALINGPRKRGSQERSEGGGEGRERREGNGMEDQPCDRNAIFQLASGKLTHCCLLPFCLIDQVPSLVIPCADFSSFATTKFFVSITSGEYDFWHCDLSVHSQKLQSGAKYWAHPYVCVLVLKWFIGANQHRQHRQHSHGFIIVITIIINTKNSINNITNITTPPPPSFVLLVIGVPSSAC